MLRQAKTDGGGPHRPCQRELGVFPRPHTPSESHPVWDDGSGGGRLWPIGPHTRIPRLSRAAKAGALLW